MPKSKKLNKGKVKIKSPLLSQIYSKAWADRLNQLRQSPLYLNLTNRKPPTKAQLAKWEKERKARELKDAKRRAKKITMTVGELEDKISEAEDRYRDDY